MTQLNSGWLPVEVLRVPAPATSRPGWGAWGPRPGLRVSGARGEAALGPAPVNVAWLDFGTTVQDGALSEPFFRQSVARRRQAVPSPAHRITRLESLSAIAEEIPPSGFIFHISRCGSTLLANALRRAPGCVVVSEAQPVSALLGAPEPLQGAMRAYGRRRLGSERSLVFKFSSWNLLWLTWLRQLWPGVPCVIVIRDPAEVVVSCLKKPPGWLRMKNQPSASAALFGWPQAEPQVATEVATEAEIEAEMKAEIETMSLECYCARAVGSFLDAAAASLGPGCRVMDYTQIDPPRAAAAAAFLGAALDGPGGIDSRDLDSCFRIYAKDCDRARPFTSDREAKLAAITAAIRRECERWANPAYARLKAACDW